MPSMETTKRGTAARSGRGPRTRTRKGERELRALGRQVRALRTAAGLSQEDLAATADLHWTYIGRIERGRANPTLKTLLKLADGLGVDPGQLIREDGRPPT